jgi:porin
MCDEMTRKISLLPLIFGFTFTSIASNSVSSASVDIDGPFEMEASYIADFYGNFSGGLNTGIGYLGMANLKIGFDIEQAGWWRGGSFFINGASTHGKSPTENFVGDFQVVSNIDAGDLIYLHELWYKQVLGNVEMHFGLQDLNAQFVASENGGYYLNSSFGIPPVISSNVPVPIFPLTGLGASLSWAVNDKVLLQGAVFDGSPTDFDENPYNLKWSINRDEGLLLIAEGHYTTKIAQKQGTYQLGTYYHTGIVNSFSRNYGFYLLADQTLWQDSDEQKIDFFGQFAFSPGSINTHNLYVGAGLNYHGLIKGEHSNTLGVAFAHAGFHRAFHKHETLVEAFFNYQLNNSISLQPDIQFVISPAGLTRKLENATIGFVRMEILF